MGTNAGDHMQLTTQLPLATRLSVFFLAMIGVVLIAFSGAFYWFASGFLHRQVEDQASATIRALMAAVEQLPQGIEWESNGRTLSFGTSPLANDIVWCVIDENGKSIDQSHDANTNAFRVALSDMPLRPQTDDKLFLQETEHWLIAERRITSGAAMPTTHDDNTDPGAQIHAALCLRAAVSLEPSRIVRARMVVTLISLSVFVWFGAWASARFVCGRALRPLREMTVATQEINADRVAERLPAPATRDELAELTFAFNALLDRLQDSFLRQQRFTGDASHQLRTPLTAILGQIEVTLRRDRSAEEYHRVLSLVHGRATHLKNIVDALLFLARADGDAAVPECQVIELGTFLKSFVSSFSDHERFADLKWESESREECLISSHPTLLLELLTILLDNSFKFSLRGTPVIVQLRVDSTAANVSIRDSGEGVAPEDIQHLGEPFFRTETARQNGIQGVGLGLSIARRLSVVLVASISFSSEIGRGTKATVAVPQQSHEPLVYHSQSTGRN